MSNNNYRRGADFERTVKKYLEDAGWSCFRSAGSHSPVDLVALRDGAVLLVQCKTDGRISPAEREQLVLLAQENRCQAVVAKREKRQLVIAELEGMAK